MILATGRWNPSTPPFAIMRRVYVTDGSTIPLLGRAIVVYRCETDKEIETKNVCEVR